MTPADDPEQGLPRYVFASAQAPARKPERWVVLEDLKLYLDALRWLLQVDDDHLSSFQTSSSVFEEPPHVPGSALSAVIRIDAENTIELNAAAWAYPGQLELPGRQPVPVAVRLDRPMETARYQVLVRELKLWPTLNHPRILPVLGRCIFYDDAAMITPYFGTIESDLKYNPHMDKLRLIIQIAEGLEYLHNQLGIVHGDLKASSTYINADGDAVLGGLALSTSVLKSPLDDLTNVDIRQLNTARYAAPEILLDQCSGLRSKTTESDIYAFGMLVYEILTGRPPRQGKSDIRAIVEVVSGRRLERPEESQMNDSMWNLCMACWDRDPTRRPRIADILAGLRSPELSSHWQVLHVEEPNGVDPSAESRIKQVAESPVRSEYHTPALSPSDQSFHTCASWASTPLRAAALIDVMDVVEEILQIEIDGAVTDIALPKQKPLLGGFGKVVKGYARVDGAVTVYAVKISEDRNVMPRELKIWKTLSHKNILPLRGALEFRGGKFPGSRKCILVSPYMKGGTLLSYLKFNPLTPRLPLMIDVANGLHCLHNVKGIVHGDIKAENVLIADDGRAVLADFGLSTTVSPGPEVSGLQIRQMYTLAYCAPEIIDEDAEDPAVPGVTRSKTKMSDVYAYGVLLYQIYAGGFGKTMRQRILLIGAMHEGRLPKRPFGLLHVLCDDLWFICRRCWARKAADRPPIATVLGELRDLESSPERQTLETPEPEAQQHV